MLSVITFSLLILRISTTSSASDIPLDPGHTIPLEIPSDTFRDLQIPSDIPSDIPLVSEFPIKHIGDFLGVIEFSQSPEGQLLSTIFEKFSS